MKQLYLLLLLLLASTLQAQPQSKHDGIKKQIEKNLSILNIAPSEIDNLILKDAYTTQSTGLTHVYLQQAYKGIELYNGIINVALRNDKIENFNHHFDTKISTKANNPQPSLQPTTAASKALDWLKIRSSNPLVVQNTAGNKHTFKDNPISLTPITAELYWLSISDTQTRLVWNINIQPTDGQHWWNIRVDAHNGNILDHNDWVVSCSFDTPTTTEHIAPSPTHEAHTHCQDIAPNDYNIFPFPIESPNFGTQTLVNSPWTAAGVGNPATTLGWHNDGTTSYTTTRGNNVYAQEDQDNNNATFGFSPTSATLDFNYPLNFTQNPTTTTNQSAAITNLFYANNTTHDIIYQYGFDEPAGNFQTSNISRGGLGNDHVIADAQDAGGTNNANFATPADGSNPRMQMYLWSRKSAWGTVTVNSPLAFVDTHEAVIARFGPQTFSVTGNIVLANDPPAGATHEGCSTPINAAAISGNIAVVDLPTGCSFVTQATTIQTAGAIGIIIVKNSLGAVANITSSAPGITIPVMMVTQADGNQLKAAMLSGTTNVTMASVTAGSTVSLDGDLDNLVIVHEYAHGISNRLTAGPSNVSCLSNDEQMGEGWSDYYALMLTTDWAALTTTSGGIPRSVGSYVSGQNAPGLGIRPYPYTTNMSVNPTTYSDVANTAFSMPHGIGSIWSTMLWDMTWKIIETEGINSNIYSTLGGNGIALQLVTDALKLQPCGPGFVDGRDAILQADEIRYGGVHRCAIWEAFARRGLGLNASQGSPNSRSDGTADFSIPSGVTIEKTASDDTPTPTQTVTFTLQATCGCTDLTNVIVSDPLPSGLTYVSGSGGSLSGSTVSFSPVNMTKNTTQTFTFQATVDAGSYNSPTVFINDDVETGAYTWTFTNSGGTQFVSSTAQSASPTQSWFGVNVTTTKDYALVSGSIALTGSNIYLTFNHLYDTEAGWDGGVVEISTNGGTSWNDLGNYIISNGYNSNIGPGSPLDGRKAFSGFSGGFVSTQIDLSSFSGQTVMIRFRMTSDGSVAETGWYIDDIQFASVAAIVNTGIVKQGTTLLDNDNTIMILGHRLPIELLRFQATALKSAARLEWETLSETNNKGFVLERSDDGGSSFKSVTWVQGMGTTTEPHKYTYTDHTVLQGVTYYYRLKQVDWNDAYNYSSVEAIYIKTSLNLVVVPNPTASLVTVRFNKPTSDVRPQQLAVFGADGKLLATYYPTEAELQQGTNIHLATYGKGVYLLQLTTTDEVVSQRVVVY
jgi:extracellular elastinolytic metalloproteinase